MTEAREPGGPSAYDTLKERAKARGVQPEYWDVLGQRHEAQPAVLEALLDSLGPLPPQGAVPKTIVLRETEAVALPSGIERATIRLEDGHSISLPAPAHSLPAGLPPGYHLLEWHTGASEGQSHLIVCPPRMWSPGESRHAGVAISLYGLRSGRNWGCGDFRDLKDFAEWVTEEIGGAFVALNPLHAIHNRQPFNTSPYLPLSGFFQNYLYLDVESIEEFQRPALQAMFRSPEVQRELSSLRGSEFVEYERVAALKLKFLRAAFQEYESAGGARRHDAFQKFVGAEGELLETFALFCALDEHFRTTRPGTWIWTEWPAEYHDPRSPESRDFAREHSGDLRFYCWIQWEIDRQLSEAQRHARHRGMPVGLYHDLALATDRFGCDLWSSPEHFATGCRVGAPPDGFAPEGQDWSFPPPRGDAHAADGYRLFIASIRRNAAHGGALRMDHAMRLFRLFWIPEGHTARDGTYVHEKWRDLLGILALESHRLNIRIIGEDLGTITDEIRDGLDEYGVLGYRVLYFERGRDGSFRRPEEYSASAVATVTTHDLPTIAGFWTNRDIEARRAAGLLPDEKDYHRQLSERTAERQKLLDLFHELNLLPANYARSAADLPELTGELHHAIVGMLASTPCELFVINQEDLTKEMEQQNLPGSTSQYPNWRRKMKYSIEELRTRDEARGFSRMLRDWLARTGRAIQAKR